MSDPTQVDLRSNFSCSMYQHESLFIYISIHCGWSLEIFMMERVKGF